MTEIIDRYSRQLALPGFSPESQAAIKQSHVAVIGAGGLGSPVLQYLAGAGVGTITVLDCDEVDLCNLHRQVVHHSEMIGVSKAESAREAIELLNPEVKVNAITLRLTRENAPEILASADLILDCCDNLDTRFVISDAAQSLLIPVVYGAITGWNGQMTYFAHDDAEDSVTLRTLFADGPESGTIKGSAEAGILGPMAGLVGCVMASETLKVLGGIGPSLDGTLLILDGITMEWTRIKLKKS